MVLLFVAAAALAAVRLNNAGLEGLMWVAIIAGVLTFWGGGVAANFGFDEQTPGYAKMFYVLGVVGAVLTLILSFTVNG